MSFWEIKLMPEVRGWSAFYVGQSRQVAVGQSPNEAVHNLRMLNLSRMRQDAVDRELAAPKARRKRRIIDAIFASIILAMVVIGSYTVQAHFAQNSLTHQSIYLLHK